MILRSANWIQELIALFDCAFLHARNPKAGKGLFATLHMVGESENQFALASCVSGAYKAFNILAIHKLPPDGKLLFLIGGNDVLPIARQNG